MSPETHVTLNTLLILIVAVLQFLLRLGPQSKRMRKLEKRLEALEERLEEMHNH